MYLMQHDLVAQIIYELNFYQSELELQNEYLHTTQQELQNIVNKYASIYDLSPHSYFILDKYGLIADVNKAGSRLLGLQKELLINRCFSRYIPSESHLQFSRFRQLALRSVTSLKCEMKFQPYNKACIDVEIESQMINYSDNARGTLLISLRDISHRNIVKYRPKLNEDAIYDHAYI